MMRSALYIAALLIVLVSLAHSWLGERYILTRLFRKGELPRLFGGTEFTKRTLRFAWHVTSVAWLGLAAVLVVLAGGAGRERQVLGVIAATFAAHFAIALFGSRGKHLSWIVFLAIGMLSIYAATCA
jgi:hypothetical protein